MDKLIGLCAHPAVQDQIVKTACECVPGFSDLARNVEFVWINDESNIRELRKLGGTMIAIVTPEMNSYCRQLAEHADRTISGDKVHLTHFYKVVRETVHGRPAINRDDPRQVRWL